jgi:hypothetical protein
VSAGAEAAAHNKSAVDSIGAVRLTFISIPPSVICVIPEDVFAE